MKHVLRLLPLAVVGVLTMAWWLWTPEDPFVDPVPDSSPAESSPQRHFVVEYGGCVAIVTSPEEELECIHQPGEELRVWVAHPRIEEVRVELDEQPWGHGGRAISEDVGRRFAGSTIDPDARRLRVHAPDGRTWQLRLRALAHSTAQEQDTRTRLRAEGLSLQQRLARGDPEAYDELLELVTTSSEHGLLSEAVDEALGAAFLLTWQAGRPEDAERLLDAIETSALRYPEGRAAWSIYHGHALRQQGRLVEAAREYRRGGRYAVRVGDAGLQLDALSSYSMVLAELGYFEAAVYWGSRALEHARTLDLLDTLMGEMMMVAATNLQLRRAGQAHDDPGPLLREVERHALETGARGNLVAARMGLAELALLEHQPAEALRLLATIDETTLGARREAALLGLRLQALLAGGASPSAARAALSMLEEAASPGTDAHMSWLAAVHRGRVLEHEGDLDGALAAYERAEDVLDHLVPLGLLGIQGEVAPARAREGTDRLVSLLLERGRADRALCTLRRSRARVGQLARLFPRLDAEAREALRRRVSAYQRIKGEYEALLTQAQRLPVRERERVRVEAAELHEQLGRHALEILSARTGYEGRPSCDALQARQPGELLLGLYPHRGGIVVLVQDDRGTTHRVLSEHDHLTHPDNAPWLGNILLDPLDAQLAAASRVRVLAAGRTAAIDVHALPWRERPLIEHLPVVYGLDLPPLPGHTANDGGAKQALVLTDEMATGTQEEATDVDAMLSAAGWNVRRRNSADTSATQLREDLSAANLLHYAGHAYYDAGERTRIGPGVFDDGDTRDEALLRLWPPYPGGAAVEPSYIPLGASGRLDVLDILMMEQVPSTVILMGCATGVHDERMAHGGFSLATAFLGAGARAVVASTRDVDGEDAALIGRGLHAARLRDGDEDPGRWLTQALRWAREPTRGLPLRAVRDYRVFVP